MVLQQNQKSSICFNNELIISALKKWEKIDFFYLMC